VENLTRQHPREFEKVSIRLASAGRVDTGSSQPYSANACVQRDVIIRVPRFADVDRVLTIATRPGYREVEDPSVRLLDARLL
jgi:hypothetical protein